MTRFVNIESIKERLIAVRICGDETASNIEVEEGEDQSYFRLIIKDGKFDPTGLMRLMPLGFQVYNFVAVDNKLVINLQYI